jgi:hypothetical protein
LVFPTTDATASFLAIFQPEKETQAATDKKDADKQIANLLNNTNQELQAENNSHTSLSTLHEGPDIRPTITEAQAIFELKAIPLYFPTSYSLVKPYVRGFEINGLDAPSLKDVIIDSSWQPKAVNGES